jgi:uncharacterized protein YdhG (YjbR/CyaY superfamily)
LRKSTDVDEFIAAVPKEQRAALLKLRKDIKAAVPKATEVISYGVPTFKLDGKSLVSFGAAKDHCSFYVMSYAAMTAHTADLKNYTLGKGSIQFRADKPLPATLVTKLVKTRVAEVGKGR